MVLASLEEDAERVLREKAPDLPLRARSQAGVRVSRWMDRRAVHGAYVRLRGLTHPVAFLSRNATQDAMVRGNFIPGYPLALGLRWRAGQLPHRLLLAPAFSWRRRVRGKRVPGHRGAS